MAEIIGFVKDWQRFQHYKNRNPPWIKLHRSLLENPDFIRLPLASKALAPMLWLLAAEQQDGSVNLDPDWLSWKLRTDRNDVAAGLWPLVVAGFIECDSELLADCLQLATPETEIRDRERDPPPYPPPSGEGVAAGGDASQEPPPAGPAAKPTRQRKSVNGVNLQTWLDSLAQGEAAVPADDPVFRYAEQAGIPRAYIKLGWVEFKAYHLRRPEKRQIDWRQTFANYVRQGYLALWKPAASGGYELTPKGVQAHRALQSAEGGNDGAR